MSSGPLPPHTSYQDSFRFTENCKGSRECFYLLHTTFLIAAAFYLSQVRNQHWSVTISQTLDVIHIFLVSSHLSLFCFRIALIVYYISPSHPLRPLWSMMASQFPLFFMEFSVFRTVGQIILYGDPLFGLIWRFPVMRLRLRTLGPECHIGELSFLYHIRGAASTRLSICKVNLGHLVKTVSASFLHCKVALVFSYSRLFFESKSLNAAHTHAPPPPFLIIKLIWCKIYIHALAHVSICASRKTNPCPDAQIQMSKQYR
jgi:hypothetical protein